MATNKIFTFAENSNHILNNEEYEQDTQRKIGNQPGIARAKLVNKALKQATLMATTLAQFIADNCGVDIDDSMTPEELAGLMQNTQRTPGEIGMFCFQTPPNGWLLADGRAVSRTTYAKLYTAIGTTFGVGNGTDTFNLPDLRGEFIRGWDSNRGVDTNRALGSLQYSQNLSHSHSFTLNESGKHRHSYTTWNADPSGLATGTGINTWVLRDAPYLSTNEAGQHTHSGVINAHGGNESRPRNIALAMFIFSGVLN